MLAGGCSALAGSVHSLPGRQAGWWAGRQAGKVHGLGCPSPMPTPTMLMLGVLPF